MTAKNPRWQAVDDGEGVHIVFGEGSDDDESFTVYLPADPEERERGIGVIVRALNRAKITVPGARP